MASYAGALACDESLALTAKLFRKALRLIFIKILVAAKIIVRDLRNKRTHRRNGLGVF
jgi:hypothetical protein